MPAVARDVAAAWPGNCGRLVASVTCGWKLALCCCLQLYPAARSAAMEQLCKAGMDRCGLCGGTVTFMCCFVAACWPASPASRAEGLGCVVWQDLQTGHRLVFQLVTATLPAGYGCLCCSCQLPGLLVEPLAVTHLVLCWSGWLHEQCSCC